MNFWSEEVLKQENDLDKLKAYECLLCQINMRIKIKDSPINEQIIKVRNMIKEKINEKVNSYLSVFTKETQTGMIPYSGKKSIFDNLVEKFVIAGDKKRESEIVDEADKQKIEMISLLANTYANIEYTAKQIEVMLGKDVIKEVIGDTEIPQLINEEKTKGNVKGREKDNSMSR